MSLEPQSILCPYCGHGQTVPDRCEECGGLFEPLSRRATQIAMGPWFVRDKAKPFRPGCSYDVLRRQVEAGKIRPHSVIRGPTTRQFWTVARHVPGVAHLLGYCHECGARVSPAAERCPECSADFQVPSERNDLGLLFPTNRDAAAAQAELDKQIAQAGSETPDATDDTAAAAAPTAGRPRARKTLRQNTGPVVMPGADLLDEVIGKPKRRPGSPPAAAKLDRATGETRGQGGKPSGAGAGAGAGGGGLPIAIAKAVPIRPGSAADSNAATAEVLDFGPSDDADNPAHESGAQAWRPATQKRERFMIGLMAAVILVLLAGMIAVAMMWYQERQRLYQNVEHEIRDAANAPAPAPVAARPAAPAPSPRPPEMRNSPAVIPAPGATTLPATLPTDLPLVPRVQAPAAGGTSTATPPGGKGNPGAAPQHFSPTTPFIRPSPPATAPATPKAGQNPPAPAKPGEGGGSLFAPNVSANDVAAKLAAAKKLEDAGKYRESLEALEALAKSIPAKERPKELDQAIARVRQHAAHDVFEGND